MQLVKSSNLSNLFYHRCSSISVSFSPNFNMFVLEIVYCLDGEKARFRNSRNWGWRKRYWDDPGQLNELLSSHFTSKHFATVGSSNWCRNQRTRRPTGLSTIFASLLIDCAILALWEIASFLCARGCVFSHERNLR